MKSTAKKESDAAASNRTERPIRNEGIGRFKDRLKEALGGQGLRAFGKKCGLSEGALFSYLSGETYPTLDRLDAIAHASDRSPAWFIGAEEGVASQHLRQDEMKMALQLAAEALEGRYLPPEKHAELVSLMYEALVEGLPEAQILRFARIAAP